MWFKHNTPLSSDPLGLPPDDPVKPPALDLEESVEDDPNLNIDPSQPPIFDPDIDLIVTGLSALSLTGILSGSDTLSVFSSHSSFLISSLLF